MTSFVRARISGPAPAWAAFTLLLAIGACAPARAGCSHRASSRADRAIPTAIVRLEVLDPTGEEAADSGPIPSPATPRRCRSALCQGGPTAPAVPAGVVRIGIESWALGPATSPPAPARPRPVAGPAHAARPIRRPGSVFHPPRRSSRSA